MRGRINRILLDRYEQQLQRVVINHIRRRFYQLDTVAGFRSHIFIIVTDVSDA